MPIWRRNPACNASIMLLLKKTTPAGEYMEDICTIHDLNQHVSIPTRGVNTLDLIVSDFNTDVKVKCLPPLGASDHVVLLADFPVQAVREPKTGRTVWRYNKADWGRLRHFYRTYDWHQTLTTCPAAQNTRAAPSPTSSSKE